MKRNFLGWDVGSGGPGGGGVSGLGCAVSSDGLWGVDGGSLVLDVGDVAVDLIGVVGHDLDATVGKVDTVFSLKE